MSRVQFPVPLLAPWSMHALLCAYCWIELNVCVCCCSLLGAATLPRLLMPYLLLIRMSCLSAAICCSCLANPLPTVWCRRGARRRTHDGVRLKKTFLLCSCCFFLKKAWQKSWCFHPGWQAYREPLCTWMASGKGTSPSVCTVSAALDLLDLCWQMLKQKVEEVM